MKQYFIQQKVDHLSLRHFTGFEMIITLCKVVVKTDKIWSSQFFCKNLRTFPIVKIRSDHPIFPVLVQHFRIPQRDTFYDLSEDQWIT